MQEEIPSTEILPRELNGLPRLVSRVYLRMHNMRLIKADGEEIVDMCWEALEACLIAHESMDIDEQQSSTLTLLFWLGRDERMRRSRSGILRVPLL